jgi:hypothetical protein
VQHLVRDADDVAELWEEVTRTQVAVIMAEARATRAERRAWESSSLLASAHGEAGEIARKVTILIRGKTHELD